MSRGQSAPATEDFSPTRVSASRVNTLDECGIRFKMQYLDRVPPTRMGSFALFGTVVHGALEKWTPNRSQDLLALTRQSWIEETIDTPVSEFLAEYQKINVAVMIAEKEAREAFENRPDNKRAGKKSAAPRMTKHFKESAAAKELFALLAHWGPILTENSPWEFTDRDPLAQFYDDSLIIAKRYQRQWGHLPPSLHTEFGFDVQWGDHQLVGYIDEIEAVIDTETGEVKVGIIDYKTYRHQPAELKDYRQRVMYDVAVRELIDRGVVQLPDSLRGAEIIVGMDYVRQAGVESDWSSLVPEGAETSGGNSRAFWTTTDKDREAFRKDLELYTATVSAGIFRPAPKSANSDYCDYGDLCCLKNVETRGGSAERVRVCQ